MELRVENLNIRAVLSDGNKDIVSALSFAVKSGEPLAIVGESGCGKTMTALSMFRLLPDNCRAEGSIVLNGTPLLTLSERKINKLRGGRMVMIPQSGADFLNPSLKIRTQLYESLKKNKIKNKTVREAVAPKLLADVGIEAPDEVLNKYPFQLSGGQAQRAVLALSLCGAPELVVADEPTKGIDDKTAGVFLDKLETLFKNACVIVITHNIAVAERCEKLLVMYDGMLMEYGYTKEILAEPNHPYTKSLIDALPENGVRGSIAEIDVGSDFRGCSFYKRCPVSSERCKLEKPPITGKNGTLRRCFYA